MNISETELSWPDHRVYVSLPFYCRYFFFIFFQLFSQLALLFSFLPTINAYHGVLAVDFGSCHCTTSIFQTPPTLIPSRLISVIIAASRSTPWQYRDYVVCSFWFLLFVCFTGGTSYLPSNLVPPTPRDFAYILVICLIFWWHSN